MKQRLCGAGLVGLSALLSGCSFGLPSSTEAALPTGTAAAAPIEEPVPVSASTLKQVTLAVSGMH